MTIKLYRWVSLIALMCLPAAGVAQDGPRLAPGMVNPGWVEPPPWFHESFLDIREDVEEAAAEGKRLMLYFYQDGCPYCEKLIRDNFGQHDIAEKAQEYFHVIAINMWGAREVTDMEGRDTTERDFARDLGVQFTPTLLMFNEDFETVARLNGYYEPHRFRAALSYIGEGLENEMSFPEYFEQVGGEPASGELHVREDWMQPPMDLAAALEDGDKPLLIFFEQAQCSACDELHGDILQREETQAQLERFQVAQVDIWSDTPLITPDGVSTTAREWAREAGVLYTPTMALYTSEDGEVIRTEGYLRSFHVQSVMAYVATGAYRDEPELQRYLDGRAQSLYEQGIEVDLMD
ncbi:thioredoxin [Ectothiorhodospira haloalkaliphila]|uniref:Thioredoxin n=1 Tax=Ectothiorhodospira haloalkaliphila TaxID=421628 RepID=W8KK83_9GAMM|nr:thioredoxin fold domain-containing protein [Ectothiorhodospira haloalkaliphila]AHK80174.1 thioredoxin [Ectothiorhodospira haloalkaliphila]MCG5526015.1 thioredoxin fold domain-containing protein [Ectothiorhodospira haloalkaliphila]